MRLKHDRADVAPLKDSTRRPAEPALLFQQRAHAGRAHLRRHGADVRGANPPGHLVVAEEDTVDLRLRAESDLEGWGRSPSDASSSALPSLQRRIADAVAQRPVSTSANPSRRATALETELLPAPAGPSMATTNPLKEPSRTQPRVGMLLISADVDAQLGRPYPDMGRRITPCARNFE